MSSEINSLGALVILGFGSLAFFFMLGVFLGPVTPVNNIITLFQCNDHGTYPVGVGFGSWTCKAPDGKIYNSHWGHSDENSSDYPRFDEIKKFNSCDPKDCPLPIFSGQDNAPFDFNISGKLEFNVDHNKPFNALTIDLNRFCKDYGFDYGRETSKDYNDLLIHYDCFKTKDVNA